MPCGWGPSRSTPSSTCCCAASSGGLHRWIWRTIVPCLGRKWRPPPPPITWLCWVRVDMDTPQVLLDHHLISHVRERHAPQRLLGYSFWLAVFPGEEI